MSHNLSSPLSRATWCADADTCFPPGSPLDHLAARPIFTPYRSTGSQPRRDHDPSSIAEEKEKQTNPLSPLRFSPSLSPLNTPLVTTRPLPSSLNQSRADENKFVYSTVTQLPGIPAEGSAGWFTGDEARWRRFNDSGCARPHQTGESS